MKMKDKNTIVIEVEVAQITDAVLQQLAEEDIVQVVRCKDCVHSYDTNEVLYCAYGIGLCTAVNRDFYCADGEKKE